MGFELLIIVLAGAGLAFWYFNRDGKSTDLNNDGKTDVKDVLVAVENTVAGIKATIDVNENGKVDAGDVKVVATKAKAGAKKTVTGAKKAAAKIKAPAVKKPKVPAVKKPKAPK